MRRPMVASERARLEKGSRLQFFQETISELKKVVWPSRQEAFRLTIMVILFSAAIGVLLGVLDGAFGVIIDRILLGGP